MIGRPNVTTNWCSLNHDVSMNGIVHLHLSFVAVVMAATAMPCGAIVVGAAADTVYLLSGALPSF